MGSDVLSARVYLLHTRLPCVCLFIYGVTSRKKRLQVLATALTMLFTVSSMTLSKNGRAAIGNVGIRPFQEPDNKAALDGLPEKMRKQHTRYEYDDIDRCAPTLSRGKRG